MKSPELFNYELRPCKFAERRMLLASLYRIVGVLKCEYQYIGFGGLTFTDFKLFHKELNINKMYSIESCFTPAKLEFNKPFSFITILHGKSSHMLLKSNLSKPSIVWLDYDGCLTPDVFTDINILFNALPHGSIYIMSCNRQLQNDSADPQRPYTKDELNTIFRGLVPFDLEENCCAEINTPLTIKKMIHAFCSKTLLERNNIGETPLRFKPLYNIKYKERQGAGMYTFGGIILNDEFNDDDIKFNEFECLNQDTPFEIDIPNLTHKESLYLNQIINIVEEEQKFVESGIVKNKDLVKYKQFYKYMPNYYDVRL